MNCLMPVMLQCCGMRSVARSPGQSGVFEVQHVMYRAWTVVCKRVRLVCHWHLLFLLYSWASFQCPLLYLQPSQPAFLPSGLSPCLSIMLLHLCFKLKPGTLQGKRKRDTLLGVVMSHKLFSIVFGLKMGLQACIWKNVACNSSYDNDQSPTIFRNYLYSSCWCCYCCHSRFVVVASGQSPIGLSS